MRRRTKNRLYTVTPNPALDVSGIVKNLTPNEKNTVLHERRDPGGNGINASRIAHRLGVPTLALGFIGGASGDELLRALEIEGVPHEFQMISHATRINITVTDQATHLQTRLSFAGPLIRIEEQAQLLARIASLSSPGLILLGGSLPPGVSPSFHVKLAEAAHSANLGVLLDVPARILQKSLAKNPKRAAPLLVKPNETELAEWWTQGKRKKFKHERERVEAGQALARRCTLVCVSRGGAGVELFFHQHHWRYQAPAIRVHGTVGAGDSFLGGVASALLSNGITHTKAVEQAFRKIPEGALPEVIHEAILLGISCGAATASELGTSLARPKRIQNLLKIAKKLNAHLPVEPRKAMNRTKLRAST
jgi:1-phosphofructokinase family hexose kinase